MRKNVFLIALGGFLLALVLVLLFSPESANADKGDGEQPCGVPVQGEYSIGPLEYHTSCTAALRCLDQIDGWDLWAERGTPLVATISGQVIESGIDGGNSTYLKISNGLWKEGHMHGQFVVQQGENVERGQLIGYIDAIGKSGGIPHDHFWLRNLKEGYNISSREALNNVFQCNGAETREVPIPENAEDKPPEEQYEIIFGMIEEEESNESVQKANSVADLPFVVDQRDEVAEIHPSIKDCHDSSQVQTIVWHQIASAYLKSNPDEMDGIRLAKAFKNARGWDRPGYQLLVSTIDAGDGFTKVFWLQNVDCTSYGVSDVINNTLINIAYVDFPFGSPPSDAQLNTMLSLTQALLQETGLSPEAVKGHKEYSGSLNPNSHSDPVGVNMDEIRSLLTGGVTIPQAVADEISFAMVRQEVTEVEFGQLEVLEESNPVEQQSLMPTEVTWYPIAKWVSIGFGLLSLVLAAGRKTRTTGLMGVLFALLVFVLATLVVRLIPGQPVVYAASQPTEISQPNLPVPIATEWIVDQPTSLPLEQTVDAPSTELAPFFFRTAVGAVWGDKILQWVGGFPELDANMAATVMTIESCGGQQLVSRTGACGLFQLWGRTGSVCTDPDENAQAALSQLQGNIESAEGNWDAAMAGYNGGPMALKWYLGEISRGDYISFLRNHESGRWADSAVAEAKADQVERYVDLAQMYYDARDGRESEIHANFISSPNGMCASVAKNLGLGWPITP